MRERTIREVLLRASRFLQEKGVRNPRLNAEVLLQEVLGLAKYQLLAEQHKPFPPEKWPQLQEWLERRGRQEPLQYILGRWEFYGRDFLVSPGVLIPRPETEILVEEVLRRRSLFLATASTQGASPAAPLVLDVGTGSGAIAVTLALEWPEARVLASDLSDAALAVARENARRLGADVTFIQGDLLRPVLEAGVRVAVLVSNPPYIPRAEVPLLDAEVRLYEPLLALAGGEDGLDAYRRITHQLPQVMCETGPALVAFEVGIHQAEQVADMVERAWPRARTVIVPDLQGIGRVVLGLRDAG